MTGKEIFESYLNPKEPCLKCTHVESLLGGCKAYPEGIPEEFSSGARLHDSVEPDQVGGFVFEEVEPDEYGQTLMTIFMNIDADIYPLLEEAEAAGKQLAIDESGLPELWDSFEADNVIFV